jgi:NAD(P)-dependent dehydrogenase (short-subunit alcohol dehydrogenase family)
MADELSGKVAIVTGGASGIGRATVEKFLAEGARVVIADVAHEAGAALAADCGPDALFCHADVSDREQFGELVFYTVDRFGGLDVMVNNAGVSGTMHRRYLEDDLADFGRVMGVNVFGVMLGTQLAARQMATSGGGSIINMSSIGGILAGGGVMTYRASKAAVIHFTKSAAIELAYHDIRVNCIAPGNIPTPLLASSATELSAEAVDAYTKGIRETMRENRPLKREGTGADVAEAAAYFASDRSRYVTGTVLPVDGGTVAGQPIRRRAKPDGTRASTGDPQPSNGHSH